MVKRDDFNSKITTHTDGILIQNTLHKRSATPAFGVYAAFCNSRMIIKDNPSITFEGGNGIWLTNSTGEFTIENNTDIRYTGTAPFVGSTGIHLEVVSGAQLYNNRVSSNGGQIFAGISAYDSPGNLYCCNSVNNSFYGALFNGGCAGTIFRNTNFGNHADGLVLGDAIIGLQDLHGNNWAGSNCTQSDAFFYSNSINTDVTQSQFITSMGLIPRGHDFIQVFGGGTPQEWFLFEGSDPTCSYYCGESPYNPLLPPEGPCIHRITEDTITEIDLWAATTLSTDDLLIEGIHNREQHRLLQKIDCLPDLIGQHEAIDQFYQSNLGSDLGQYHQVRNSIEQLFDESADDDILSTLYKQRDDLIEQIQSIGEQLGFEGTDGLKQRDSLVEVLSLVLNEISQDENFYEQGHLLIANNLIADNASLNALKIYEYNEQTVNHIYLNTLAKGILTLDNDQQVHINEIAAQCPLVGGIAVHEARALQALYAPQYYNNEELCANVSEDRVSGEKSGKINSNIKIYPNPAADFLHLQSKTELLNSTVEIFGLDGRSWLQQAIQNNQEININALPEGIYLCIIRNANAELLLREKVLILRH